MIDYKEMYFHLMHETARAISLMQKAQQDCEEMYLNATDTPVVLLEPKEEPGRERCQPWQNFFPFFSKRVFTNGTNCVSILNRNYSY